MNPSATLAFQVADWFQPFVSYKQTSRSPNVQEMFNTSRNGLSVNPFLKPESAKTYEIGFNIHQDNVLLNNDILGLKAVYFNSRIKDYLYNLSLYGCGPTVCRNSSDATNAIQFQIYVNHPEKVKNRGWEVELAYDSDAFLSMVVIPELKAQHPLQKVRLFFMDLALKLIPSYQKIMRLWS